ncbi:MAG: hypothetical protein M3326_13630, partial [Actinomycetota bacterium]|nr:hypothetical protein [Actinomycetota bacterium]
AVLPARAADTVRAAGAGIQTRGVVLAAVLAVLLGLPAVLRRTVPPSAGGRRSLQTRRHSIALRAPPLQSA